MGDFPLSTFPGASEEAFQAPLFDEFAGHPSGTVKSLLHPGLAAKDCWLALFCILEVGKKTSNKSKRYRDYRITFHFLDPTCSCFCHVCLCWNMAVGGINADLGCVFLGGL